jgi:hypothetical protein
VHVRTSFYVKVKLQRDERSYWFIFSRIQT